MKKYPTQEELKKHFMYNPWTGIFYRKPVLREKWVSEINRKYYFEKNRFKAYEAGTKTLQGYIRIKYKRKQYTAHRLAFLYCFGYIPENEIDHINRDKSDNRISNLREASRICNTRNIGIRTNNKTGVIGVCKGKYLWRSTITVNYKSISLGEFDNFNDAVKARWEGEKYYEFPNCNTTSTAYLYLKENKFID